MDSRRWFHTFVASALTVAGMIYIIALLDSQLALVAIAVTPVLYLGARTFNLRLRNQWGDIMHPESSAFFRSARSSKCFARR